MGKGTISAADLLGGTSEWSFGPGGECIRREDFGRRAGRVGT